MSSLSETSLIEIELTKDKNNLEAIKSLVFYLSRVYIGGIWSIAKLDDIHIVPILYNIYFFAVNSLTILNFYLSKCWTVKLFIHMCYHQRRSQN